MRPPATRLHRLLALIVDPDTLHHVVEPAIADLQHEAAGSATATARSATILAGYVAIARALVVSTAADPRSWLVAAAILSFGVVSATVWNAVRLTTGDPRIGESALLLPTFAVPVVACAIEGRRTYARLFALSVAAGGASVVALDVLVSSFGSPSLLGHVVRLSNGVWSSTLTGALAAALAWGPFDAQARLFQRAMAALAYAALLCGVTFVLRNDGFSVQSARYFVMRAPFFVVLFAAMLGLTVLPLILIARCWLTRTSLLTLVGAACFPAPIIVAAIVDGASLPQSLANCLHWSWPAFVAGLPFLAGATTLGWLIGARTGVTETPTT